MWITGSSKCHQLYSGKINQILMMNALLIYSTVANEGGGIDRENPEIESFSTPLNTSDEKLFLLSSVLMNNRQNLQIAWSLGRLNAWRKNNLVVDRSKDRMHA